ncbi:UNVERIFIED_CONTAM: hypothetical protein Sradi_3660600 [Sesamum radiatum]|uniref:PWWP domain-containing protein n=1 Tax=Sesamum radiatum TaxID=300843 RepID=A0AAW2QJK6_SESRA
MECGEIKYMELALMDLFTRVKFGTSDAKRFRVYLEYDSVASGTARFIKSSWIRMRGEIANQISPILAAREESQFGGNAFAIKRDGLMGLVEIMEGERYNQSAGDRDKGIRPLSKEWLKTLGRDFDFGELVWGKIDPHPLWPGQIYDEALATLSACLTKEKGRVLVAFFGDNTYGWLEPENVVPFERHFDEKSKQSEDHLFLAAVEEAMVEVKKRSALGLTCKCHNPSNFRPTEVQGFLEVDVAGYGARSKYSIEQIKKARNGFKPREMFSFLQKLALNPTIDPQNNFTLTRNVARVLAYRKSVFKQPDETYPLEFEAIGADSEHHADVSYGKKKPHQVSVMNMLIPFKSHSEFSESADALVIMGNHSPFVFTLDAINLYSVSCLHFHVVRIFLLGVLNLFEKSLLFDCCEDLVSFNNALELLSACLQLEELEGSPQHPRSSDPPKIDDKAKQVEQKVPEVGIQNNNLRKNASQKRSLQDNSTRQLRIFDSDDLSRSNKKRSSPDVQEETITNKQNKGKAIDSMVARKKLVDNKYSDQTSTKTATVANHEEHSTEQTVMIIKIYRPARMPSVKDVKEEFADFGPFDEFAVRTFWKSSTCRIVFTCKSKAQSAYHHGLRKRNLFGLSKGSYYIQPLKGSAAELAKSSNPNMQLPQEDLHQMECRTLDITPQYAKDLKNMNLTSTSVSSVAAYPMGGRSWPYLAKLPGVYPPRYPAALEEVGRLYPPPPARYTQVGGLYPPLQGYTYPPPPPGYGYPPQQQPPQREYGYPVQPPPPSYAYRPPIGGRWDGRLADRRYDI